MSSGSINPNPGNNINDLIFQSLSFAPLGSTTNNPPAKPEAPKAATWLADQKRFVPLQTYPQIENFVMQFFNDRNPAPEANDLASDIDMKMESIESQMRATLTNPNTDPYPTVEQKVRTLANQNGKFKVLYSSPANLPEFKNNRQTAILIPDIHNDADLLSKNFSILRSLFTDPNLHLSSGFSEGPTNVDNILGTMPAGLSVADLDKAMSKQALIPDQALMYWLKSENAQSQQYPNAVYASFNPEKLSKSSELEHFVENLIPFTSGGHHYYPGPQSEAADSAKFKFMRLYHTKKQFQAKGMMHEFYSLIGSTLKRTLDAGGLSDTKKDQIAKKTIELITRFFSGLDGVTNSDNWQMMYNSIPQAISIPEIQTLGKYLQEKHFQYNIVERNESIVNSFVNVGNGTRSMVIGIGHIDASAGQHSLLTLLEQQNIPVIIIGPKDMNLV